MQAAARNRIRRPLLPFNGHLPARRGQRLHLTLVHLLPCLIDIISRPSIEQFVAVHTPLKSETIGMHVAGHNSPEHNAI